MSAASPVLLAMENATGSMCYLGTGRGAFWGISHLSWAVTRLELLPILLVSTCGLELEKRYIQPLRDAISFHVMMLESRISSSWRSLSLVS